MLMAAEPQANGTPAAHKENGADEQKQPSELDALVSKIFRFFGGGAAEAPAQVGWNVREVRDKISELREELQSELLEADSGELQPSEKEPLKRRAEPNLELTML